MPLNILEKEENKKQYQQVTFTEKGYSILKTYLGELVKLYRSDLTIYPFKQGIVLGLPLMTATQIVNTKEELLGRIKCLMMLLGLNSIEVELDNGSKITYQIGDKNDN